MAELTVQFVRPDRLMYEGPVASVILATPKGELGIWPGRRPIICALGDGVVRINRLEENGGGTVRVVVSGGYAEVDHDTVIILADHARRTDDIDREQTEGLLADARAKLASLDPDDNRSAYWGQKVKWWTMLLKYAES
ncbi:MAG: ATP synthase F1 subunit epsilon [Coriobacteriaceae bacterium]|nr:ATP synthase F1 subunit epsilon [Coriobacteriaceae bacterium]